MTDKPENNTKPRRTAPPALRFFTIGELGRSTIYEMMNAGKIRWTKVNARRLIIVESLFRMLGAE
jgi:hypothetical protein